VVSEESGRIAKQDLNTPKEEHFSSLVTF